MRVEVKEPAEKTIKEIVDEKMQVLEDLYIATRFNKDEIRNKLMAGIKKHPGSDPELVVDQVAKSIIAKGGL